MPSTFRFDADNLTSATYLERFDFTTGGGSGVNDPTQFAAVATSQAVDYVGDVDIFAMTFVAGQTYTFDVDDGYGDAAGGSVDLQLDIISQAGILLATSDNPTGARDPLLSFTASSTGTYFVAVHHANNDYVDGFFSFVGGGSGIGDYSLVVSTPSLLPVTALTNYSETRTFSGYAETVKARGGQRHPLPPWWQRLRPRRRRPRHSAGRNGQRRTRRRRRFRPPIGRERGGRAERWGGSGYSVWRQRARRLEWGDRKRPNSMAGPGTTRSGAKPATMPFMAMLATTSSA